MFLRYTDPMSRNLKFSVGEYYHVYNRGVEKRATFLGNHDYQRFIFLLFLSNSKKHFKVRDIHDHVKRAKAEELGEQKHRLSLGGVLFADLVEVVDRGEQLAAIGAYCLMPNHFHFLLKEIRDGGISDFLQKVTTAYTMYFNKKNERVGSLFQNTFKAEHVGDDTYLQYLYSYIHLNPVKLIQSDWKETGIRDREGAKRYLDAYSFSSYADYCGKGRAEKAILNTEEFPDHFSASSDFNYMVDDWLDYHADEGPDTFGDREEDGDKRVLSIPQLVQGVSLN